MYMDTRPVSYGTIWMEEVNQHPQIKRMLLEQPIIYLRPVKWILY